MEKVLVILFCFFTFSSNIFAKEKILNYFVMIDVQNDNSAIITERILAYVETKKIKKGINKFLSLNDNLMYKLISVKRNNKQEPSSIVILDNIYGIIIGNDYYLPTFKKHMFEIKYKVNNIIKHNEHFDELYWNIIGDRWNLDIDKMYIKIVVPNNIIKIGQFSYININSPKKEKLIRKNSEAFKTPRKIKSGEEITVVLLLKKSANMFGEYNLPLLYFSILFFIILVLYCSVYLFIIKMYNKKLEPFERYDIPKDMPPAIASDIYYMGKHKEISSLISLISMAVDNFLKIRQNTKNKYLISKNEFVKPKSEEEIIFTNTYKDEIKLSDEYIRKIRLFYDRIKYYLSYTESLYFTNNTKLAVYGYIGFFLSLIVLIIIKNISNIYSLNTLILTLLSLFFLFLTFIKNIKSFKKIISIILIIFVLGLLNKIYEINSIIILLYMIVSLSLLSFFRKNIRNYTEEGQEIVTHLECLKLFMENKESISDYNQEDMEKLIPYSIIFNYENEWIEKINKASSKRLELNEAKLFKNKINEQMLTSFRKYFNKMNDNVIFYF